MSRYLYRNYVRLISKWPKDAFKSNERDLQYFMSREVEKYFKPEVVHPFADTAVCERRLQALEQLSSNDVGRLYPHTYTSGVFGLKLSALQEASRDENRRHFGLTQKKGLIKRTWESVFPKKSALSS